MFYTLALTYNLKPETSLGEDAYSEFDSAKTIQRIAGALRANGHSVYLVEATPDLPAWFRAHRVDLVVNLAEGASGDARESRVPAILDFLGIPYTGSGVLALALALDKGKAKQLFRAAGIPTPAFQVVARRETPLDPTLRFPLIVKPNREGSAKGIWASSVVTTLEEAARGVQRVLARYDQPALVEEFIEGTELTVGVLGEEVLPLLEIDFSSCEGSGERFYSWRMKEFQGDRARRLTPTFWCPARLTPAVAAGVQAAAHRAHEALGCRDLSRVDVRLAADGTPYVLEVNPLPGLDPDESNYPMMARAAGLEYPALLERLVQLAAARAAVAASMPSSVDACTVSAPVLAGGMATLWPSRGGRCP